MTGHDSYAVILARLEVKLDQLIESSSDHEIRMRKLEESQSQGKNWQVILTNSLLTAVNAALAGTTVLGGG